MNVHTSAHMRILYLCIAHVREVSLSGFPKASRLARRRAHGGPAALGGVGERLGPRACANHGAAALAGDPLSPRLFYSSALFIASSPQGKTSTPW